MSVKGTRSWCVLEEYVKENCYAIFHTITGAKKHTLILYSMKKFDDVNDA